jgi:hypothetical protein
VVVVEGEPLLEPQIVPVAIVAIVLEHRDARIFERIHDLPHDGGLPRSGPSGDTNDQWLHRFIVRLSGYFTLWTSFSITGSLEKFSRAMVPSASWVIFVAIDALPTPVPSLSSCSWINVNG